MTFPLVEDLAAEGVPVKLTCGVLGFSPQAFYKWKKRPCSNRDWADAHADDPEFGYRFIADELEQAGHRSCERRVWRLCRQQKVWSTTTKKGRRSSGKTPGPAVHDDLVQRVFTAPAPDVVWLTGITEHATLECKLYCCAIKDVFSNRIVGYSIGDRMTAQLAVSALRSTRCCRRTSSTGSAGGGPEPSSATRSSSGSNTPTTGVAGSASSAGSPPSSSSSPSPRRSRASKTSKQHDQSQPPSTERAAVPRPGNVGPVEE